MPIKYMEKEQLFKLDGGNASYIFEIGPGGYLLHLYYGPYLPDANVKHMKYRGSFASFSPNSPDVDLGDFTADLAPMEYSCNGTGDFRISALQVRGPAGDSCTDIRYVSHEITKGKPELKGLPALFAKDEEAETLSIVAEDKVTGLRAVLLYTVFEQLPAMCRSVRLVNASSEAMDVERVYSCCLDLPGMDYEMTNLYGQWFKERSVAKRRLQHGLQGIHSKRGSSSHNHNPFIALAKNGATEEFGEVYGFNLVYSGNFDMQVEVDQRHTARLIGGINPADFGWHLEPGEEFTAPEMVMVFSDKGMGEMSRIFHRLYRQHLLRGLWADIRRPVLINSWEAAYFDFDDDKLVAFAEEAAKMGIEMLVMDDGWFGHRNKDNSSLGDWFVNENKLKGGMSGLIERVNALGLKFGIWYEPEMISPDSELYRAHPDWCLHARGRQCSLAREQLVLDMSRQEVRDNIFRQMYSVLANNKIDYVKWDFNRNLTEAASAALPPNRQKEIFHRFVLGTYELMDRFVKAFPNILFENCSGGGGRFDPGMLYYSPQIWCSDNTDAIERLTIQFGTSMCYPVSTMGAHVSGRDRTPIATRAAVALCGSFGYELDPRELTDEEKEEVRGQIEQYNKYNNVIHKGDMYRIIDPNENHFHCAWQFVSPDKSESLVTVVIMRLYETPYFILRLQGLDPKAYYMDMDSKEIYSGALLMGAGINLTPRADTANDQLKGKDGDSLQKYFKRV